MSIGLEMWPLEPTKGKKMLYNRHSIITIAHSEHFVLSWAKKVMNDKS